MNNFSVMISTKIDWQLGFLAGINLDGCSKEKATFEEAYIAGYAYAMDWLIKAQQDKQAFITTTLFPDKWDWRYPKCPNEI